LEIVPRYLSARLAAADDAPIQQVFQVIASDAVRTAQVADDVTAALPRLEGREGINRR